MFLSHTVRWNRATAGLAVGVTLVLAAPAAAQPRKGPQIPLDARGYQRAMIMMDYFQKQARGPQATPPAPRPAPRPSAEEPLVVNSEIPDPQFVTFVGTDGASRSFHLKARAEFRGVVTAATRNSFWSPAPRDLPRPPVAAPGETPREVVIVGGDGSRRSFRLEGPVSAVPARSVVVREKK